MTVTVPNLPIHTHLMGATTTAGGNPRSVDNTLLGTAGHNIYGPPNGVQLALGTLQYAGGGAAHANMQPFQVINFNIALYGIFPSRN